MLQTDQECQHCDDTYDKINFDTLVLTDKVRDIKKRIRETPWYHIRAQWRLYIEARNLSKQTDEKNLMKRREREKGDIMTLNVALSRALKAEKDGQMKKDINYELQRVLCAIENK